MYEWEWQVDLYFVIVQSFFKNMKINEFHFLYIYIIPFMFKELLNNVDQVTCVKAVLQNARNEKCN